MSSIDERVVEAKFDNRQFQEGVKGTLSSLDNLKKGLNLDEATKNLSTLANATGRISHGFSVMRIAAATAIATIAHQATIAGERLVRSFTVGPLIDGLHEYETQLNSVQTILSNTQWEHTSMNDVNKALNTLNTYSDKTIYNFSQMARNVGTFTAAGVKLDTSVNAIKGIANLAAVSGSSADQASTAMYQLSQALASGTVKLMDWNSVVNAGMGGKVFQDALIQTAKVHGKNIDAMIKKEGSFRNTLQKGWLTSKILTETLAKFTGDQTRAQLKRQGYTAKEIDQIIKLGKTAQDAATKIKTGTQLISTLKEAAGSGWTQTWQLIIGNFTQARKLWTNVYNVLGTAITNSAKARNKLLSDWSKLGGRTAMLDSFKNAFTALLSILKPIRDAFREIFPKTTAKELYDMTVRIRDFFARLKIGADTANNLKRTFAGLFALLDIGWQIIKTVGHFLIDLFSTATKGAGGILNVTGNLGDFLVALDKSMKKGKGLQKFFDGLEHTLKPLVEFLRSAVIHIAEFGGYLAIQFGHLLKLIPSLGHILSTITHKLQDFFSGLFQGINFDKVLQILNAGLFAGVLLLIRKFIKHFTDKGPSPVQSFIDKITAPFTQLTDTLKTMQQTLQAATLVEIAVAVGVLTASVFTLSKINAADLAKALGAITAMFGQLFLSLAVFNKVGGAKGLFTTSAGLVVFGTALRVLTSSVKALAALSWQELAKGLVGVTALIGALVLATKGMGGNAGGMVRAGAGLLLLAAGIKVLASAVTDLSGLSWGEIAKGLTGIGALLVGLTLFTKFAAAGKAGVLQGAGLVLLATGIKILASAAADFGNMSWGEIAKGLVTIGLILGGFAIFSKTVGNPLTLVASSAALVGIGIAMNLLAVAMGKFGKLSWGKIAKGLVSMAGALTLIVLALNALPITAILGAASLVLVSTALIGIAGTMKILGTMSWGEIAKGLVALAGALTIIAVAMSGMTSAILGAAALTVVAVALALLVPELVALGAMSWMNILKGLVALAGALTVIGLAGVLLTEALPSLFGLAGSIALLGIGIAAIGGGVYLLATGLTLIAISGAAAASSIKLIFESLMSLLPDIAKAIGATLVALAQAIADAAPELLKTAITLFDTLLEGINEEAPKIINTFFNLMLTLLTKADDAIPKMARKMARLMIGILDAVNAHIKKIVNKFTELVVNILQAMTDGSPLVVRAVMDWIVSILVAISHSLGRIETAGGDLIIAFIRGLGDQSLRIGIAAMQTLLDFINGLTVAIRAYTPQLQTAGKNLAFAIADGMTLGLASKVKHVADGAVNLAKSAFNAAKGWLISHSPSRRFMQLGHWVAEGFAIGIVGGRQQVIDAWNKTRDALRQSMDDSKRDIADYAQKLKDAQKAHNPAQIRKYTLALAEARKEYNASSNALDLMNHHMKTQHDHLLRLSKRYDEYTNKLNKANDALKNAKQIRDDYKKSVTEQYDTLPDIAADTSLAEYEKNLKKQIVDTQSFADVMAKLKKLGLDDQTYKELIAKGPEALPFAEQVLAGGKDAVGELNKLDSQLAKEAKALGTAASTALYQAGVDSAQGLVDGLKKNRDKIAAEMRHIAHILVAELKKELKIKSPSEVFDELGLFTGKGLALGLRKSVPHIQKATRHLGKNTIESMKKSIAEMNDQLAVQTELNPTITPVLDLSMVRRQAGGLGQVLSPRSIALDAAYLKAVNASSGYQTNREAVSAGDVPQTAPGDVTFIQNNNSPKPLSTAEIYRNTNNQLSRVKGALKPSAA